MTIKEIEQATGLPRASVRFYESEKLISPSRGENGYRDYSQADLDALLRIKLLRRLDVPLEDIRALQTEQQSLPRVLDAALARLEQEAAQREQARDLCRALRREEATWATLDPQPYLRQLDAPVPAAGDGPPIPPPAPVYDRLPDAHCPFRRFFARSLDFYLYNALFLLFCQLVLRANVLSGHPVLDACTDFLVPLGLTLLLEPLMLHFFCTTPGKFLFGLKITRGDGSPLGLKDAFSRTGSVLVQGMGLNIPLLSTITQGYSLYQICKGRRLGWDYDLDEVAYWDGSRPGQSYWDRPASFAKLLGAGALAGLAVFALLQGRSAAMAPRHQGDLTVAQFVENFNDTQRFHLQGDEELNELLTVNGTFEEVHRPGQPTRIVITLYDDAPPLVFQWQVEDGLLTGLSFSYEVETVTAAIPIDEMASAVWSLLYGREGIGRNELTQVHDELLALSSEYQPSGRLDYHHDFEGASVDFTLTSQGYVITSWGTLLPLDQGAQTACQMDFSLALTG